MMNLLNNPNIFSKSKLQNKTVNYKSNGTLKVFMPCMFDKSIFSEKNGLYLYFQHIRFKGSIYIIK